MSQLCVAMFGSDFFGSDASHAAATPNFAAAFINKATTPGDWSAMSFAECQKPAVSARELWAMATAIPPPTKWDRVIFSEPVKPAINGLLTTYTDRHG